MAFLDAIGGIGKVFKDIVGTFKLSPEAKAELERELAANELKLKALDVEIETKLAETAGQNIRTEAGSADKFTSRARPTFLYVGNFIIVWNYVVAPTIGRQVIEFPESLFWLFGSVMLGYVGARSWEKTAGSFSAGKGRR